MHFFKLNLFIFLWHLNPSPTNDEFDSGGFHEVGQN